MYMMFIIVIIISSSSNSSSIMMIMIVYITQTYCGKQSMAQREHYLWRCCLFAGFDVW